MNWTGQLKYENEKEMFLHENIINTFYIFCTQFITGLQGRVFVNGPGDLGLILPKTLKMVLDTSLLNTQQYKVRIEAKAEPSREMISALP